MIPLCPNFKNKKPPPNFRGGVGGEETMYNLVTVHKHCSKKLSAQNPPVGKLKFNRAQPSKLKLQDKRSVLCAVLKLHQSDESFT